MEPLEKHEDNTHINGVFYRLWMQDGALMGARFDKAIDPDTDEFITNTLNIPRLSANDSDTAANELRTHLIVTGTVSDDNEAMFSLGALLGGGTASDEGANFVVDAVEAIEKVQADVTALLALDTQPSGLEAILDGQWAKLDTALDTIFGDDSDAVRDDAPREEDILDDIADILDALSSEDAFVAATAADGGGVFEDQALGSDAAANAFNRATWSASATLGMTGDTRYGTAIRKKSDDATSDAAPEAYGAFSYATMQQTVRTADAAAVSLTGIASYSGGTRAINMSGDTYSGTMDLQVRFKAEKVSGVVSGLEDADGLPWKHNFADVERIVLEDADLNRNAKFEGTGNNAQVFYTANSGLLRPVPTSSTLNGILLGQGADAGSAANGTWTVGTGNSALSGGFGVVHVGDASRPTPGGDDGSEVGGMLLTTVDATPTTNFAAAVLEADGTLKVTGRKFGWTGRDGATAPTYQALGAAGDETMITAEYDLADLAGNNGATVPVNGPKWIDGVINTLTEERDLLATLQGLNSSDTQTAELAAWQRVQDVIQFNLFGETGQLPAKFDVNYADDGNEATADLSSEAEAVDLIDRALDALSSNAKLEAAVRPDGTGIFAYWNTGTPDVADTEAREDRGSYVIFDDGFDQRRWEFITGALTGTGKARTIANFRGEREHKVWATMGTTDFTRFGVWRREDTTSARRNDGNNDTNPNQIRTHGGPGAFAYSPLDATHVGTLNNLSFPAEGTARYTGETVAYQLTTILTGTAQVDVSWGAPENVNAGTTVGTMALTISGLASAVGDPLTQGGSATVADNNPGNEIADIVFGSANIIVGATGAYANNLIVGTAGTADDAGNVDYTEIAAVGRYRRADAAGDITATGTQTVKALFVGQGVDGPLGVIGTWTLTDGTVGRYADTGDHADDYGLSIVGAFGAQIP